jgi:hypothetical protein
VSTPRGILGDRQPSPTGPPRWTPPSSAVSLAWRRWQTDGTTSKGAARAGSGESSVCRLMCGDGLQLAGTNGLRTRLPSQAARWIMGASSLRAVRYDPASRSMMKIRLHPLKVFPGKGASARCDCSRTMQSWAIPIAPPWTTATDRLTGSPPPGSTPRPSSGGDSDRGSQPLADSCRSLEPWPAAWRKSVR